MGGTPTRVVRLSAAGGETLDRWLAGRPVGDHDGAARLARRLADSGLAVPVIPPAGGALRRAVSVVIPVHNRPDGLAATLLALRSSVVGVAGGAGGAAAGAAGVEVIVVDDGSDRPGEVTEVVDAAGLPARVVRRGRGGPAAARNSGWRVAGNEVAVFLDADCIPHADWLDVLLPHMDDPSLGAVAPRVGVLVGAAPPRWLTSYEQLRSPLDMGPTPAPVRPGGSTPYVPSAALAVRIGALRDVGGFDERLRVGEDVDLVWRLVGAGWRVRYDPAAGVAHPRRPNLRAWARQRWDYGTSAQPLAARHGSAAAPLVLPWPTALASVALVVLPAPAAVPGAAVAIAWTAGRVAEHTGLPVRAAGALAVAGYARGAGALAEALRRPWWPVAVLLGAASPRLGRKVLAGALAPLVVEWARAGRPGGAARWVGVRLADDMAYGAGVWAGCMRAQRFGALRPRLTRSVGWVGRRPGAPPWRRL